MVGLGVPSRVQWLRVSLSRAICGDTSNVCCHSANVAPGFDLALNSGGGRVVPVRVCPHLYRAV